MISTLERRIKPRVECDYPVIVEGFDELGNKYCENGKLENLSASGLYMVSPRYIPSGTKISVTVLLSTAVIDMDTPRLVTHGTVVRTVSLADGTCCIAVKFNGFSFQ